MHYKVYIRFNKKATVRVKENLKRVRVTTLVLEKQDVLNILSGCLALLS